MSGIHYVTDKSGNPTAVLVDLKQWSDLLEDIYDGMVAEQKKMSR